MKKDFSIITGLDSTRIFDFCISSVFAGITVTIYLFSLIFHISNENNFILYLILYIILPEFILGISALLYIMDIKYKYYSIELVNNNKHLKISKKEKFKTEWIYEKYFNLESGEIDYYINSDDK